MLEFRTFLRSCALALTVGVASVLAAPVASASPALVRDGNGGDVFNGNGLSSNLTVSISVTIGSSTSTSTVYAAPFALQYSTDNGGSWTSFLTYCLEPDETLGIASNGTTYAGTLESNIATTTEYSASGSAINQLYATYFADSLTSSTKAAAFQVALWELAYDTGSSLTSGAFKLNTTGAIATQAAIYLNSANWTANGVVGTILRVGNQDLLVSVPNAAPPAVPEPASLALLGAGLGLLGLARRRRRA